MTNQSVRRIKLLGLLVVLATVFVVFLSGGCSDPKARAAEIGHAKLKADAAAMLAAWRPTSPTDRFVPKELWPDSIRRIDPDEVVPHMCGVLLVTSRSFGFERGVYVVLENVGDEETSPSSGSGLSYEPIAPGLHFAKVTIRSGPPR